MIAEKEGGSKTYKSVANSFHATNTDHTLGNNRVNNANSGTGSRHIDNSALNGKQRKMNLRRNSFKKDYDNHTDQMNELDASSTSNRGGGAATSRTVIIRNSNGNKSTTSSRLADTHLRSAIGPSATVSDLFNRLTPSSSSSNKVTRRRRGSREVIEYEPADVLYDLSFVSTHRALTPSAANRSINKNAVNKSSTFNLLPPASSTATKSRMEKQFSVDSESTYALSNSNNNESRKNNFHVVRRTQTSTYQNEALRRLVSSPLQMRRNSSLKVESSSIKSASSKKLSESIKYLEPKSTAASAISANRLRRSKEINLSLDSHMVNPSTDSKKQHFKQNTAASTDSERSNQNNALDTTAEAPEKIKIPLSLIADHKIRMNLQERSKTSLERDYQTSNQLILGKSFNEGRKQLTRQLTTSSLKNATSSNEDSGDSGISTVDYESSKIQLKNNIQSSFLTYGSTVMNPFGSNFDIVSKDNPSFYKSISSTNGSSDFLNRRFNRANANPSVMTLINHFRSVNLASDKINEEDHQHAAGQQAKKSAVPAENAGLASQTSEAIKIADKETSAKSLSAFNTVRMTDLNWTSNVVNSSSPPEAANRAMSSNDSLISNHQAVVKQNFFLNYRQLTDLKKDESGDRETASRLKLDDQGHKMAADNRTGPNNSNTGKKPTPHGGSKSAAPQVTSRSTSFKKDASDHLLEHRLNNGPENFLEAHKIIRIQSWIEEVERVQRVEGKWRDVINVITFYD